MLLSIPLGYFYSL